MTVKDKLKKYFATHTTPVTVSDLATRFAVHKDTISDALNKLEDEGITQRHKLGRVNMWTRARSTAPLAIPKPTNPNLKFIPQHVKQSSYAHVRGYED